MVDAKRVLIVEDNWMVAMDLADAVRKAGGVVIGPAPTLDRAMQLLELSPNAAVVDIHLSRGTGYPLADELMRLAIPFVFASSEDRRNISQRFESIPLCPKPISPQTLLDHLFPSA